jgi:hypothetical protein
MERSALFSPDRIYRFELWRRWDNSKPYCQFIGLNPSIADEQIDDPTIRRCIAFAMAWRYGALLMTNLFAFRSTDPKGLGCVKDAIGGAANDKALIQDGRPAPGIVIAAFGSNRMVEDRATVVIGMFKAIGRPLHCLGRNRAGWPSHPLYMPASSKPIPYP